jgi:hypothetical protein
MAEKRIESKEIIQDNLFGEAAKSASDFKSTVEELEGVLKGLNITLGQVSKEGKEAFKAVQQKQDSKSVNEFTSALEKQEAVRKEAIKAAALLEKQKKKEEEAAKKKTKETKKLTAEEIKQREMEKITNRERTNRLKNEAILMSKNMGEIQKLRAQNVLLRLERDKLNTSDSLYEANLKRLNSAIDANNDKLKESVDQLTKQKMNVGNYTESIKDAFREMGFFGQAMGKITAIQKILGSSFKGIQEEIKLLTATLTAKTVATNTDTAATTAQTAATNKMIKAKKTAIAVTRVLGSALKLVGVGLILGLVASAGAFFTKIEEGRDMMGSFKMQSEAVANVIMGRLGLAFQGLFMMFSGLATEIKIFAKELKLAFTFAPNAVRELKDEIENLRKESTFKKGLQQISDAFSGMGEEISKATEAAKQLFQIMDDFGKTSRLTRLRIAELNKEEQRLSMIVNDQTLSFQAREKAQKALEKASEERAQKELFLAQKQLEFEIKRLSTQKGLSEAEIKQRMKTQQTSGRLLEDDLEKLLEYQKQVIDSEGEISRVKEANLQNRRVNEQKAFLNSIKITRELSEGELNNLKKIAENSDQSFATRREAQNRFESESKRIFKAQIQRVQERTKKEIDLDDLIATNSATELEDKIRALELDAKTESQLSDTIEKYKLHKRTLEEIGVVIARDLAAIEARNAKALMQMQIDNDEFRLYELKKEMEKNKFNIDEQKRIQQEIYNIRKAALERDAQFRIDNEKLTADEIMAIRNKLALDIKRLEMDEIELGAKALETQKQYYDQTTAALKQSLDEQFALRQNYFNLEQRQREQQIRTQTELAAKGFENQLAFEEVQSKKAEQKRKEQLKREQRQREAVQLSDAILNGYNNNLKQGQQAGPALQKAIGDAFLAKGIARSVVQFFSEGSGFVDAPWASGRKDDIPAMLMKGEGVVTTDANKTNPGVVEALNKGIFSEIYAPKRAINSTAQNMLNSAMLMKLSNLEGYLSQIADKPAQRVEVDQMGNFVEKLYKSQHIEKNTYKINWKK